MPSPPHGGEGSVLSSTLSPLGRRARVGGFDAEKVGCSPRSGARDVRLDPDGRRESSHHQTGLLALLQHPERTIAITAGRQLEAGPQQDLGEARDAILAVHRPLPAQIERDELDLRGEGTAWTVKRKHASTAASSRDTGLHASPRPSYSSGGADRRSGAPGVDSAAYPLGPPMSRTGYVCGRGSIVSGGRWSPGPSCGGRPGRCPSR
jgi:hypothetical protein